MKGLSPIQPRSPPVYSSLGVTPRFSQIQAPIVDLAVFIGAQVEDIHPGVGLSIAVRMASTQSCM